jgi:hypothetical protein
MDPNRPLDQTDQTDADNAALSEEIKTLREEHGYTVAVLLEMYKTLWDTVGAHDRVNHLYEKAEKALAGLRNPLSRSDHAFFSTGCYHGQHGQCQQICKICSTPCLCPCHIVPATAEPARPSRLVKPPEPET